MKIYTKTGDKGETGLFGGPRVWKDELRIEAYGTVDELNATLGVAIALDPPPPIQDVLQRVQNELFAVGAELASPDPDAQGTKWIAQEHVMRLEQDIDSFAANLPPLKQFILPGGTAAAAQLHFARGVCRRAERRLVSLTRQQEDVQQGHMLSYVNRLSDLLFVLSRAANKSANLPDVVWNKPE